MKSNIVSARNWLKGNMTSLIVQARTYGLRITHVYTHIDTRLLRYKAQRWNQLFAVFKLSPVSTNLACFWWGWNLNFQICHRNHPPPLLLLSSIIKSRQWRPGHQFSSFTFNITWNLVLTQADLHSDWMCRRNNIKISRHRKVSSADQNMTNQ